ncbi:MAG: cytidylate kinase-like family protein [Clostridium sp.]|nr:cytidylate kinase-like family protein [Clostridium sp.]
MNRAITISRQYGSGGRELGEKLAKRLGIPFYDKELIAMIAREGGIEPSILEANDEVEPDLDNYSTREIVPEYQIAMTQRIYEAQARVIEKLGKEGACVIVGRCADAILPEAVNVFVFGDLDSRLKRIMSLHPELSKEEAKESIALVDRRRKAYHEYYSPLEWGKMDAYDICLNSGLTGVDGCLEAVLTYIEHIK